MSGNEYFDLIQVVDKIIHDDPKFDVCEHYLFLDGDWKSTF